jgi:hypothetical protein
MSIDAGIYQLAGRGVKSVAEYDAEASRAKQNKLAEMMGGMKMDEAKRGIAGENALAQLLAGGKSGADVATGLAAQGFGKQSMAYTKQSQDLAKDKVTMEKEQLAMTVQKLSLGAQLLGGVKDQASYDQARTTAQANGLDVSRMPPQFDPAFVAQKLQEGQTVKEQLEQHWKAKGYDLDVQKVGETQRHNKTTEGLTANGQQIQIRGQDMTDQRARDTNQQGKVPAGYRATATGLEAIPGGPADLKAGAEGQKRTTDANDVLSLLDEVDALLPKSTGSTLGAAADWTAGAFGHATEGAKTVAQLKMIQGALVAKMPKMTGPQSDKDVLLYREMAGQVGDSSLPVETRQAAASMLRKLNEKYAGMQEGDSLNAPKRGGGATGSWGDGKAAAPVSIKTAADYANIPSGSTYIDPNGQMRKKP